MDWQELAQGFQGDRFLREVFAGRLNCESGSAVAGLSLQILVPGQPSWRTYYLFEPTGTRAVAGLCATADVTLTLPATELEALARGELDLTAAVALRRIQIFGNPTKARLLSLALRSPAPGTA
ncbi:MAG: SCP2 sterol-binding domain-containing protein [Myxococcaceae bacterium]